jgi:hypothetical protein
VGRAPMEHARSSGSARLFQTTALVTGPSLQAYEMVSRGSASLFVLHGTPGAEADHVDAGADVVTPSLQREALWT